MSDNQFNFNGVNYELREPQYTKTHRVKRLSMFEKDYITPELVLFCVLCGLLWATLVFGLITLLT